MLRGKLLLELYYKHIFNPIHPLLEIIAYLSDGSNISTEIIKDTFSYTMC